MNGVSVLMLMGLLLGGSLVNYSSDSGLESTEIASSQYTYTTPSRTASYSDQSYFEHVASAERSTR